jgi:hypothetical protein
MADKNELFGAHSTFVNKHLRDEKGVVVYNREETIELFKKGLMAYRETFIGGCTNTGDCDVNPLDIFHVECILKHCSKLAGNVKKLNRAVSIQGRLVAKLQQVDTSSPEYRHERSNLDILTGAMERGD